MFAKCGQDNKETVLIVPLWNWNVIGTVNNKLRFTVLIVPLWNWNAEGAAVGFTEDGFNRTFMELKYWRYVGK